MQDKEHLVREQKRLLAHNQYLQRKIVHMEHGTNEDGVVKANSQKLSKDKKCRVSLTPVRVPDESLIPARKKPNDDR